MGLAAPTFRRSCSSSCQNGLASASTTSMAEDRCGVGDSWTSSGSGAFGTLSPGHNEMRSPLPQAEYMRLVCGDVPNLREEFDSVGRRVARGLRRVKMLEPGARLLD